MTKNIIKWLWKTYKAPIFSPTGFLVRACVISLIFFVCHAFGLREYTTILSGTSPTGNVKDVMAIALGATYLVLYFAFVLGVPILILASVVFYGFQRRIMRRTILSDVDSADN